MSNEPSPSPTLPPLGTTPTFHATDEPDWRRAHQELSRLAKTRARLDWEEGRWMVVALRAGAHLALGFASCAKYIENLFGYTARWTSERLRVAEALEHLPELDQTLRDGALSWSAVRELTRVAVPENEHQWIRVSQGRSARQIEELVAGHRAGDSPGEPSEGVSPRHVLRFEVSPDTHATFRESMAKLRRDSGGPLDDDEALLLMARSVLGGPMDAGRASYQVALTVCEECGRGWQHAAGQQVPVDSGTVEMAGCDAQEIGRVPPSARIVAGFEGGAALVEGEDGGRTATVPRSDASPHVGCARKSLGEEEVM